MPNSPRRQKYTAAPVEDANGDVEMNKEGRKNSNRANEKQNDIREPENGKELTVYYSGETGARRRTSLEKYLIILCILLFLACLAFIVIAFTRGTKKGKCRFFLYDIVCASFSKLVRRQKLASVLLC